MRFSSAVILGKSWRPSGTSEMPRSMISWTGSPLICRPFQRMRPAFAAMRPQRVRSVVVFPAPFAPTSDTSCPLATSKETPQRAWAGP